MVIRVNLEPFEAKTAFSYLRHTVNFSNSNCEDLYSNLWKAQIQWRLVAMFLKKTGAPVKYRAMMYEVFVQVVIIYGSKIWVVMDPMMRVWEDFHHSISRSISGMMVRRGAGGE